MIISLWCRMEHVARKVAEVGEPKHLRKVRDRPDREFKNRQAGSFLPWLGKPQSCLPFLRSRKERLEFETVAEMANAGF